MDLSTMPGRRAVQPYNIHINVLENLAEEMVSVEVGPGVGEKVWLILENTYGKTRFSFGYSGQWLGNSKIQELFKE